VRDSGWVPLIHFPAHAFLILEERLKEQEAEGVEMPEGMERDELALRIFIAAELTREREFPTTNRGPRLPEAK
jgi:hypothetical protein